VTAELKSCPCCGSPAAFVDIVEGENIGGHCIACTEDSCGLSSAVVHWFGDGWRSVLAERWNRRAAPSQPEGANSDALTIAYQSGYQDGLKDGKRVAGAAAPKRCEYCDGTGDVHSIDGEWRGRCSCAAGATAPDEGDAARLDFLIEHEAFVVASYTRIDPTHKYQCWNLNDDPDERHLSGEHDYFDTPREAIDAAIAAATPSSQGGQP
jgi:hypothetical protein